MYLYQSKISHIYKIVCVRSQRRVRRSPSRCQTRFSGSTNGRLRTRRSTVHSPAPRWQSGRKTTSSKTASWCEKSAPAATSTALAGSTLSCTPETHHQVTVCENHYVGSCYRGSVGSIFLLQVYQQNTALISGELVDRERIINCVDCDSV